MTILLRFENTQTARACRALALALSLLAAGCSSRIVSSSGAVRPPARQRAQAMKQAPESAVRRALRMQSEGAFDPMRDDAAVQRLRAALTAPGNSTEVAVRLRLQLAQRYEAYGLADSAFDEYTQALKLIRPVGHSGDDALRNFTLLSVARSGAQSRRAGEAVSVLDAQAAGLADSESSLASAAGRAELSMQMGLLYAQLGDQSKAEESFRAAVRARPEWGAAHNNLGYQLMQRGLLAEAETQFREALAVASQSLAARNNLGLLLAQRGESAAAWEQFTAGAADRAEARNNFAVALLQAGKLVESREQLALALRERRGFAPALRNFQIVQARIRAAQASASAEPFRAPTASEGPHANAANLDRSPTVGARK